MTGTEEVLAHFRHTPPSALQIEQQIRWEHHAVERGVKRYREMTNSMALAETTPGMRAMKDIIPKLVPAIKAAQEEAIKSIQDAGKGRQPDWWWLISFLSADQLAVISLKCAFSERSSQATTNRSVQSVARQIGSTIYEQMQFEEWREEERRLVKEAKEAGETRPNLYDALVRSVKVVDRQVFRRWSTRIDRLRSTPWPIEARIQIGVKLIDLLVEASGQWFEIVISRIRGGKTERHLRLSALALAAIEDMTTQAELARPFQLPMICPPRPWVFTGTPTDSIR